MISASNFYGKNKDSGIPLGKGTICIQNNQ